MKKSIAIVLMLVLCIGSAFAIDISLGLNTEYDFNWNDVSLEFDIKNPSDSWETIKAQDFTYTNLFGFNGFFDAQYVRLSVGANWLLGGEKSSTDFKEVGNNVKNDFKELYNKVKGGDLSVTCVDVALIGKVPFKLGFARLYPLMGFEASFNVIEKKDGDSEKFSEYMKRSFGKWSFVGGLGTDIYFGKHFFMDINAVVGIELIKPDFDKLEEDFKEGAQDYVGKYKDFKFSGKHNYQLDVKLGFGYTF